MGQAAHRLAKDRYESDALVEKLEATLTRVVDQSGNVMAYHKG